MPRTLLIPSLNIVGSDIEPYIPYGLLSLQAACEKHGVPIDLALPARCSHFLDGPDALLDHVLGTFELTAFEIIGFSSVCDSFHYTAAMAEAVRKRHPSAVIILGGPYATRLSKRVRESFPVFDYVFEGEAEQSLLHFLMNFRQVGDRGLHPGIECSENLNFSPAISADIDDLASISLAKDLRRALEIACDSSPEPVAVPIEATRGCPLQCSFCSTRLVWGAKVRRRSVKHVLAEMQLMNEAYGSTFFSLVGDNLSVPRKHFMDWCADMASMNPGFTWGGSMKLDRLSSEHLSAMWDAGCRSIFVGVESGNQETLDAVRKKANVETEIDNIFEAIKMGFSMELSLIIGFPWESTEDVKKTLDLHSSFLKAGAARSQVCILCPIPGTDIVKDGEIIFDGLKSNLTRGKIPLDPNTLAKVLSERDLFSYFGRYSTPKMESFEISAAHDSAVRISALHEKFSKREVPYLT